VLSVSQRAEIINNIRQTTTKEQIENELSIWEEKCVQIRKQIANCNAKKNMLIWLLNKSIATERESLC
jgi:hypothetical protein